MRLNAIAENLLHRAMSCLLFLFIYTTSPAQLVGTVAGNGGNVKSGDNAQATCAGIPFPSGIAIDATGNLYISSIQQIRKVDPSTGVVTTIAGTGMAGFSGDGGLAVAARLNNPGPLCTDGSGNLYIAETEGHRIRKIAYGTGIITTIAGTGVAGFSGDGGAAISAQLNYPFGICLDANGNLYIADNNNFRIRRINLASGIINTVAGSGSNNYEGENLPAISTGLSYPRSVCVTANGNIYIAETVNSNRVRMVNGVTGLISTVAGNTTGGSSGDGGPAIDALLNSPSSICIGQSGHLFVAESNGYRVRRINLQTGIITAFAGNGNAGYTGDLGPALQASFNTIPAIQADNSGNLFIADNGNNRVRKIYMNLTAPPSNNPRITIDASSTNACSGEPITFTATVTNAGANFFYQWYRNDINVGTNSNIFTSSNLSDGDIITCRITSTTCNGVVVVSSNEISITGSVTPTITISTGISTVCSGSPATFTAVTTNAGDTPLYQWLVNGVISGENAPVFTSSDLINGDQVSCRISIDPSFTCVNNPTAVSNVITMEVTQGVSAQISISASVNDICPGTNVDFTASTSFAGLSPSFQWLLNGLPVGDNTPNYSTDQLKMNDQLTCRLTPGINSCSASPVLSNALLMQVKPLPSAILFPLDTVVTAGSVVTLTAVPAQPLQSFEWLPSAVITNPLNLIANTIPLQESVATVFVMTGLNGCTDSIHGMLRLFGNFMMPTAFTPNDDGLNDIFRIPPNVDVQLKRFSVFDRWGQTVFSTTNIGQGWNGTQQGRKNDPGVYIYLVDGLEDGKRIQWKGTVTLIR